MARYHHPMSLPPHKQGERDVSEKKFKGDLEGKKDLFVILWLTESKLIIHACI